MRRAVGTPLVIALAGTCSVACTPVFATQDCYRGLALDQIVEVELVEANRVDGPYAYWALGDPAGVPSCDGVDGLTPGTRIRFRLTAPSVDGCRSYSGVPVDPVPGVTLRAQPGGGIGRGYVVASQNDYDTATCSDTWWRFFAVRHVSLDDDPFGESLTPGILPPVLVKREINGCCLDWWVGVIRHVETPDAGSDGG